MFLDTYLKFEMNNSVNASEVNESNNVTVYNFTVLEPYCIGVGVCTSMVALVGIFGNFLAVIVFLTTNLRQLSNTLFLVGISLSDTFYLITHVLFTIVLPYANVDVETENSAGEKFRSYVETVTGSMSLWFILAFSVQRYMSVRFPHKYQQIWFPKRRKQIVVFTVLLNVLLYLFILILPSGNFLYVS